MELVDRRDAVTLVPIIQRYIVPGTRIWSDEWPVYNGLNAIGYVHQTQWRRSQVKSGGINIQKIEGVGSGEGLALPSWGLGACGGHTPLSPCSDAYDQTVNHSITVDIMDPAAGVHTNNIEARWSACKAGFKRR